MLGQLSAQDNARHEQLGEVEQILRLHSIPPTVRKRVLQFYKFSNETTSETTGVKMSDLPPVLQVCALYLPSSPQRASVYL